MNPLVVSSSHQILLCPTAAAPWKLAVRETVLILVTYEEINNLHVKNITFWPKVVICNIHSVLSPLIQRWAGPTRCQQPEGLFWDNGSGRCSQEQAMTHCAEQSSCCAGWGPGTLCSVIGNVVADFG